MLITHLIFFLNYFPIYLFDTHMFGNGETIFNKNVCLKIQRLCTSANKK